jgi:hypothetical protein
MTMTTAKLHFCDEMGLLKNRSELSAETRKYLPPKTKAEDGQLLATMARSATTNEPAIEVGDYVRKQKLVDGADGARECKTWWYRIEGIGKTVRSGNYVYMQDRTYIRVSSAKSTDAELADLIARHESISSKAVAAAMNS